jgi:hypothetical protein
MNTGVPKPALAAARAPALSRGPASKPAGDTRAEVAGELDASSEENSKENSRSNLCIPACERVLDSTRAGKCDPATLCLAQIEPQGDIVQLPQLGDLDTLAAFVQASFAPFSHEFDAGPVHDEQDAPAGLSETCSGFEAHVEKLLGKKKRVCSTCGDKGHTKRSCLKIANLG